MPLYKVVMTERIKKTITAYVNAPTERAADDWASMVEDGETVGSVVEADDPWGEVESVTLADAVPAGWRHTVAVVP